VIVDGTQKAAPGQPVKPVLLAADSAAADSVSATERLGATQ